MVWYYLTNWEHLRDNDQKLIATIWREELRQDGIDFKRLTAFEFLQMFAEGKLTSPEKILNARKQTQDNFIELRGNTFNSNL